MKKRVVLSLSLLILSGCGGGTHGTSSLGEKECIDYRNDYMQYVMEKYSIISEKDYDKESSKNVLWSFEMFYSKPFDKCIAAYAYDSYEATEYGVDVDIRAFYIDDAFGDDYLRYDNCFFYSDDGCKDMIYSFFKWRDYYRTGEGEPGNS